MRNSLSLVLSLLALPAFAQDLDEGSAAFVAYCAGCHGVQAEGDGPMAPLLTIPPPDLTRLAEQNNGVFPMAQVIQRIDGTTEVLAHGGPMPIFGMLMQGPSAAILTPDGSELIAQEAIVNIAGWLEGMQK